jgi:hypothetical protein
MDHMTLPAWLGKMDKAAWDAVIPNMGVMALLMNLRNFDKVDISEDRREYVMKKISDEEEVVKSRVLPMQFLNAYKYSASVSWHWPIEKGINYTLSNIPKLSGRTLIMIDMSNSMSWGTISEKSQLTYADAAKIFGSVLKMRNYDGVDLFQYGNGAIEIAPPKGSSIIKVIEEFTSMGGTETASMLKQLYNGHDRVIIVTDEQAGHAGMARVGYNQLSYDMKTVGEFLPKSVPMYTWNLAGYAPSHAESNKGNKYLLGGGFSDASFATIPILERKHKVGWPWENVNG